MSASQSDPGSSSGSRSGTASQPAIEVDVNGESQTLASPATVAGLLHHLGMTDRRVAVAVNRRVVVRSVYAKIDLVEGDRIEILEAVGGG